MRPGCSEKIGVARTEEKPLGACLLASAARDGHRVFQKEAGALRSAGHGRPGIRCRGLESSAGRSGL